MKILSENINGSPYYSYIVNTATLLGSQIAILQDNNVFVKALNEFKPDIVIVTDNLLLPELQSYKDKNKAKVILFSNTDHQKKYDILITQNRNLTGDKILYNRVLPNFNIINSSYVDNKLKSKASIMIGQETNEFLVSLLTQNYNIKVFGNKKINSPRYLGKINPEQRNNILKSSEYVVDFGTYDYLDALLLGAYPIVYTQGDVPNGMLRFWDMASLVQVMDYIMDENNRDTIESNRLMLYQDIINNTSLDMVKNLFSKMRMKKVAKQLEEIKKETLS